jgi:hypothetical protein
VHVPVWENAHLNLVEGRFVLYRCHSENTKCPLYCILAFIHIKCIIETEIKPLERISVSFFDMEKMKGSRKIKPFNIYHNEQTILGKDTHKGIQDCERILKLKLCKEVFLIIYHI